MIDRKTPPKFSTQFNLALPSPEVYRLPNGISVFWIKNVDQPVVKIEVIYKGGKFFEPAIGVSFFTSALIDKGTNNKTSKEIADELDRLGAQFEASSGLDYLSVSLYSLNRTLKSAWNLFAEILTEPIFPVEELELSKQIQLQNLKINNEKNSFIASKLIRRNVFGQLHPYGRYLEEQDILKIESQTIRKFFSDLTPHQVYITGKIDPLELNLFIKWLGQFNPKNESIITVQSVSEKKIERVEKSESLQSAIRLGKQSIKNNNADYAAALVYNHTLGGYFGSRLMKNIREEKGLTYGIYSSLNNFMSDAFFSIGADVNKENIELTLSEIKKELQELQQTALSEEELTIVKNHLLGNLQLELANPFSITEKIKSINLNNLPVNFYQNLADTTLNVTSLDIQKVANDHFNHSDLFTVIVG